MRSNWYDVAQICMNGHVINRSSKAYPQFNKNFCDKCGAVTITKCPNCNKEIQGEYHMEGIMPDGLAFPAPAFCHNCGDPYPWTESKIKAAKELTKELKNLTKKEKETVNKSFKEIIKDSPNAELAAIKFKKLLPKVGKEAADFFRKLLVDIASESVKKILWP